MCGEPGVFVLPDTLEDGHGPYLDRLLPPDPPPKA